MANSKILIVEDEGLTAIELQNKLKMEGYDVPSIASSGEEAVEKAINIKPDLILMDIMLNGKINGIEAAKEIKCFLDVPIIYITAYGDEETLKRAKITEPHAYILKPFDEKDVKYAIEIALHKHKTELKLKEKEKKFRSLYYNAPLAYQLLDKYGCISEVNQAWLDILGYSRDEVIGKYFGNFLTSKDYNKFRQNFEDFKDVGHQKMEFETLCKDGAHLTVKFEIKTVNDDNSGFKQIHCIFYNITEHKNTENKVKELLTQKEILLEEINRHLQNSYLNMSNSINLKSKDFEDELDIKLQKETMQTAGTNDLEIEKIQEPFDFAIVDFAQYIESLVEDLLSSYNVDSNPIDINLNVDSIMLDLNTSLSCGLIINELLKNSLKNALLKRKICKINVDFSLNDENFILTVNDNCTVHSEDFNCKNSDLKLVNMLVKQLGGTIRLDKSNDKTIKIILGK